MKGIYWVEFEIFKDGKDTGRSVATYYNKFRGNRNEKINALFADYEKSLGYELVFIDEYPDDE